MGNQSNRLSAAIQFKISNPLKLCLSSYAVARRERVHLFVVDAFERQLAFCARAHRQGRAFSQKGSDLLRSSRRTSSSPDRGKSEAANDLAVVESKHGGCHDVDSNAPWPMPSRSVRHRRPDSGDETNFR